MRNDELNKLKSMINSPSEKLRDEGFSIISVSCSSTDKEYLSLIRSENEIVKIRFLKFISINNNSRAGLQIARQFLDDDNPEVREQALSACAEIECIGKKDFIIDLLQGSNEHVMDYAIREAGKRRMIGAIDILFGIYRRSDIKRKIYILKELRNIRGTSCIPWLIKEMEVNDTHLLYEVLLTVGLFHKYLSWNKFIVFSDHPDPAIRKAAIWALGNYRIKTIRNRLLDQYFSESDTTVQNEIITILARYRDKKIMLYLLDTAAHGKEFTMRLLAESALDRFPKKMIYALVRKYRRHKDDRIRAVIMEKAGSVCSFNSTAKWLVDALRNDPAEPVRAIAAESLGMVFDHSVIPHLEHSFLFDQSQTVRYTALLALTALWRAGDWETILSILEFPEDMYSQSQQIILRFLQKRILRDHWELPEKLRARIMFNLYSVVVNIRYLSIEIIKIINEKKAIVPLIDIYMKTEIEDERLLVIETIQKIAYSDPEFLFSFMLQSRHNEHVFIAVMELFEKIRFAPEHSYEMILQFSALFISERKKDMKKRLAVTVMNIFGREYENIPELIEQENWNWIKIIMECAKYTGQNELKVFGSEIFLKNLNNPNDQMREIAVIMVGALSEKRAIETLTKLAITNKSMKLRELAKISLHQILNEDTAA
ncbi:MAG: HEAT repeat domain-containing protein [Candidatus Auribacterota bacterium]|jgi:HEAT repeat protein|nr:HEAT repeat domain-containing protein [Candidatus Auribacterota bacterium]